MSGQQTLDAHRRDPDPSLDPVTGAGVTRHRVVLFVGLTYAFTWIPLWTLVAIGADVGSGPALVVYAVAASGPSIVAGVLWLIFRREHRPARAPSWWVLPLGLIIGAAVPVLPALALHGGNESAVSHSVSAGLADSGGIVGFFGLTLLTGPLAEEFGWRGYLMPRARRLLRVVPATLVLGVIWALWHLPLFFLHGTGQQESGLLSVRGILLLVGLIPFTFVYLFLTERLRGGVLAALFIHFGFNGADTLMPSPDGLAMTLELVVLLAVTVVVALLYRRPPLRVDRAT